MTLHKSTKRKRIFLSSILFSMIVGETTSTNIISQKTHGNHENDHLRKEKHTNTKRLLRAKSKQDSSISSRKSKKHRINNKSPRDPKKTHQQPRVIESIYLIDALHNFFNADFWHSKKTTITDAKERRRLSERDLQYRVPPPGRRPDRGSRNPVISTVGLDDDNLSLDTEEGEETNALNEMVLNAMFGSDEGGKNTDEVDRDENDDTGIPIPLYTYNQGNCPNSGSLGVPCAPSDIGEVCDKYNRSSGSLRSCLLACEPSICCIHDAPESDPPLGLANCNQDENCAQYAPCYIVWWKLSDMVGPATEFMLEQNDDFFDVPSDELVNVIGNQDFFQQLLFHHFDDIEPVLDLLAQSGSIQDTFALPEIWDANSAISGKDPST